MKRKVAEKFDESWLHCTVEFRCEGQNDFHLVNLENPPSRPAPTPLAGYLIMQYGTQCVEVRRAAGIRTYTSLSTLQYPFSAETLRVCNLLVGMVLCSVALGFSALHQNRRCSEERTVQSAMVSQGILDGPSSAILKPLLVIETSFESACRDPQNHFLVCRSSDLDFQLKWVQSCGNDSGSFRQSKKEEVIQSSFFNFWNTLFYSEC